MKNRFTHRSKIERSRIRREIKDSVFARDKYRCQFCFGIFQSSELTIDHLIPLAEGGLDEITNYVSCCTPCNQKKAAFPLHEFAKSIGIEVEVLPVHGDPVIDNESLPIQIRMIRKRIFDQARLGKKRISGKSAQKKVEKNYRRAFWETPEGKELEGEFPSLPGQVRVMIPEIQTIATDQYSFLLLLELAKSAVTRNLIGSLLTKEKPILKVVQSMKDSGNDEKLKKRIHQAWLRWEKEIRSRGLDEPAIT